MFVNSLNGPYLREGYGLCGLKGSLQGFYEGYIGIWVI